MCYICNDICNDPVSLTYLRSGQTCHPELVSGSRFPHRRICTDPVSEPYLRSGFHKLFTAFGVADSDAVGSKFADVVDVNQLLANVPSPGGSFLAIDFLGS